MQNNLGKDKEILKENIYTLFIILSYICNQINSEF